jgi:hypothetical protein
LDHFELELWPGKTVARVAGELCEEMGIEVAFFRVWIVPHGDVGPTINENKKSGVNYRGARKNGPSAG